MHTWWWRGHTHVRKEGDPNHLFIKRRTPPHLGVMVPCARRIQMHSHSQDAISGNWRINHIMSRPWILKRAPDTKQWLPPVHLVRDLKDGRGTLMALQKKAITVRWNKIKGKKGGWKRNKTIKKIMQQNMRKEDQCIANGNTTTVLQGKAWAERKFYSSHPPDEKPSKKGR